MTTVAFVVGSFIGGFLAIYILAWLTEKLAFRSLEPDRRALFTTATSWILAGTIAGYGMADGGSFHYPAYLYYLPSAIAFFFLHRRKLWKAWEAEDEADVFS